MNSRFPVYWSNLPPEWLECEGLTLDGAGRLLPNPLSVPLWLRDLEHVFRSYRDSGINISLYYNRKLNIYPLAINEQFVSYLGALDSEQLTTALIEKNFPDWLKKQ
jgi:hypothetical protein